MSWTITPQTKVPVDPQFGSVSLLLHGNGTNGSTTITDNSPSPKTVTAVGNAQISTAQSKFGGSSIAFDASNINSKLNVSPANAFLFGTANFTIECWFYTTGTSGAQIIWSQRNTLSNGISFRVSSNKLNFFYDDAGTGSTNGATTVTLNTWNHAALTREADRFKLWLNGALDATSSVITASVSSPSKIPTIGGGGGGGGEIFSGFLDEIRVTSGIARYTANFTPPAAQFPDI